MDSSEIPEECPDWIAKCVCDPFEFFSAKLSICKKESRGLLKPFIEPFRNYRVTSLFYHDPAQDYCIRLESIDESQTKLFWIEPNENSIAQLVAACSFDILNSELLDDFLTIFGGFKYRALNNREDFPLYANNRLEFFGDQIASSFDEEIQCFDEWKNSPIIYYSDCGDLMLAKGTRGFGWFYFPELRVQAISANVAEFVSLFGRRFWVSELPPL